MVEEEVEKFLTTYFQPAVPAVDVHTQQYPYFQLWLTEVSSNMPVKITEKNCIMYLWTKIVTFFNFLSVPSSLRRIIIYIELAIIQ